MARMYVVSTRWSFQPSRGKIVKRQRLKGWLREDGELLTWPRIHNMPVQLLNPVGFKLPEEVDVSSPLERALQALVDQEKEIPHSDHCGKYASYRGKTC